VADTIKALAKAIRCSAQYGDTAKPYDQYDDWQKSAHPYRVTLRYRRRQLTTDYWMGQAHTSEPDAASVINSLLLDARCGEMTFDEFCSEMGCDVDSRKAEATHRACERTAKAVRRLLGADFDRFANADGL